MTLETRDQVHSAPMARDYYHLHPHQNLFQLTSPIAKHLQGQMRYQKICWDSQIKNFVLVGMFRPQSQHQGPKGVGYVICATWRTWGALPGANEISKDLLGLPDEELFIGWDKLPTAKAWKDLSGI